jgi:hypothetical protein
VDDLERRINPLFDALNCETLSTAVVGQLGELTKGAWWFKAEAQTSFVLIVTFSDGESRPRARAGHPR